MNQEEHKRLVAYSLLAALNEEEGHDSLDYVFLPFVKKGLIELNNKNLSKGASILEIRNEVNNIFGLDFPLPYLKKLIIQVSKEFKRDFGGQILLHKDNSFQFEYDLTVKLNANILKSFEEKFATEDLKVQVIESLFQKFLEINEIPDSKDINLITFIELNKIALSNYFSKDGADVKSELKYKERDLNAVANFFLEIKKDKKAFGILKNIYIGSVFSSYLTIEPEQVDLNLELVFDTSFILGLLNLKSPETSDTCKKIYELAIKLHFQLTVLYITIEETKSLLDALVLSFDKNYIERNLNPESILEACDRQGISKSELARISAKLEETLQKQYNINIEKNDLQLRKLAKTKYKELFFFLRSRKPTDFNALHDTVGEVYVIEKRGAPIYSFVNSKIWFVKGSSLNVYKPTQKSGLPPFISSAVLVNILWLSNPLTRTNLRSNELAQIGLTKLISSTLDGALPPPWVMRKFDQNITKLAEKKIDVTDCIIVATRIAEKEIINEINSSIEKNLTNPNAITKKIKEYKTKIEKRDEAWQMEIERTLSRLLDKVSVEKSELVNKKLESELKNVQLNLQQAALKEHLLNSKVNRHIKNWKQTAYFAIIPFLLLLVSIVLSLSFEKETWNPFSKLFSWAESQSSLRQEIFKTLIIIAFAFAEFILIKIILTRLFNSEACYQKRKSLTDMYADEIEKIKTTANKRI